jgi:hypothetical protein
MFAPIFPAAPLFAIINFYVNFELSLKNYTHQMKREVCEESDSIGM